MLLWAKKVQKHHVNLCLSLSLFFLNLLFLKHKVVFCFETVISRVEHEKIKSMVKNKITNAIPTLCENGYGVTLPIFADNVQVLSMCLVRTFL